MQVFSIVMLVRRVIMLIVNVNTMLSIIKMTKLYKMAGTWQYT